MMTDFELAQLVARLYAPQAGDFDHLIGSIWTMGLKRVEDGLVIVCRGSVTKEDFLRDAESEGEVLVPGHEDLGPLPRGFARGLPEALEALAVESLAGEHLIIAGHSLGAAEACILAGALAHEGTGRVLGLGCPRPGTRQLEWALYGWDVELFANGLDPVPQLPIPLPGLNWVHPGHTETIWERPGPIGEWGIFARWHQIALYVEGLRKREGVKK